MQFKALLFIIFVAAYAATVNGQTYSQTEHYISTENFGVISVTFEAPEVYVNHTFNVTVTVRVNDSYSAGAFNVTIINGSFIITNPANQINQSNPATSGRGDEFNRNWTLNASNVALGNHTINGTVDFFSSTKGENITIQQLPPNFDSGNLTLDAGGPYDNGDIGIILAIVKDSIGQFVNIIGECTTTLFYPNGTTFRDNRTMTYRTGSHGEYTYTFVVPNVNGSFLTYVNCTKPIVSNQTRFDVSGALPPSAPSAPSAPSGGAGGGIITIPPELEVLPPEEDEIRFVRWNILKELEQGKADVLGITVRNIKDTDLKDVNVELLGIPPDWFSVEPSPLDIPAGALGGFTIAVGIPQSADPGDYRVVVRLKNEGLAEQNFFVLRVKKFVPDVDDKPIVTRTVEINRLENRTNVELDVFNPQHEISLVQVQERIAKVIADTTDEIDFRVEPQIIRKDPLVQWDFPNMTAGETRSVGYSVAKTLPEFTEYVYWTLEQLTLISEITGLAIEEVRMPALSPGGRDTMLITIRNTDPVSHTLKVSYEAPKGWVLDPQISDSLQPDERKTYAVLISVPPDTDIGVYTVRLVIKWDETIVIREYRAIVLQFPPYILWLIAIAAVAAAGFIAGWASRRKKKGPLSRLRWTFVRKITPAEQEIKDLIVKREWLLSQGRIREAQKITKLLKRRKRK